MGNGGQEMLKVEDYEAMRRAYFREGLSVRQISQKFHHGRGVVRKALAEAEPQGYILQEARDAPVLGPYKTRIGALLDESDRQRRKQRYTAHNIYKQIQKDGYAGSEISVRRYVGQQRRARPSQQAFLPLEFDPGQDAQADWGEAEVEMVGERITVQFFAMRLNHSRARFVTPALAVQCKCRLPVPEAGSLFRGSHPGLSVFRWRAASDHL